MPFRERVKRAFGSRPSLSNEPPSDNATATVTTATSTRPISHQPTKTRPKAGTGASSKSADTSLRNSHGSSHKPPKAKKSKKDEYADWPEHIYKPHEMPPPKYRRPPDSRHAARLNAYDFGRASDPRRRGRRDSETSIYSPCGSRFSTRYHSVADHHVLIATIEPVTPPPEFDTEMVDADADDAAVEDAVATPRASGSRRPSGMPMEPLDADDTWDHEHSYLTSSITAPAALPPTRRGNVVSTGPDLAHVPPLSTSPGSADSDLDDPLADDDAFSAASSSSVSPSPPLPLAHAAARPRTRSSGAAGRAVNVDKRLPPVPRVASPPRLKLPSLSHGKPFSGEDLIAALTRSGLDIEGMGFRNGDWDE